MRWSYPLVNTSENKRGKRTYTPREFSHEVVGVDASVRGGLRPFPGFKQVHSFTGLAGLSGHTNSKSEIIDLFPINIRIGTSTYAYGFVYRAKKYGDTSATNCDIVLDYYIAATDAWLTSRLVVGSDSTNTMDVTTFGRYVYILEKGKEPLLFYIKVEAGVSASATWTFSGAVTAGAEITLISTDTTTKQYKSLEAEVASTATITITDYTELNNGDKVNLIATDGSSWDFVCGDQSSVNGTWEATGNNNTTATGLMNCINTISGPSGTRFTAETGAGATADNVVTVTQATKGSSGTTTVTLTDGGTAGMSKTNFTGGVANGDLDLSSPYTDVMVHNGSNVSESAVNFKAAAEHYNGHTTAGTRATGEIEIKSTAIPADFDYDNTTTGGLGGTHFSLQDSDGTLQRFVFDNTTASISTVGTTTTIGIQSLAAAAIADQVRDAIAGVDDLDITALPDPPVAAGDGHYPITLRQGQGGTKGNTSIGHSVPVADVTDIDFTDMTGGTNTNLFSTALDAGKVTMNQVTEGDEGNTTITADSAWDGSCSVNPPDTFTGGADTWSLVTESDTGPGLPPLCIAPDDDDAVQVGTLTYPATTGVPAKGQVFLTSTKTDYWNEVPNTDTTTWPEDQGDPASLEEGDYAVAYVLYDSDTGRKSSLSEVAQVKEAHFTVSLISAGNPAGADGGTDAAAIDPGYCGLEIIYDSGKFDKAYIMRSVRVQDAGGTYAASVVQLDKIITLEDYHHSDQSTGLTGDWKRAVYTFRLPDLSLIYQDPYVDRSSFDQEMPKAGAGIEFDGTFLVSQISGSASQGAAGEDRPQDRYRGLGEFRWSSMAETNPELFPPENYFVPSKMANEVSIFKRVGGMVLGFGKNVIMHISREVAGFASYFKILPIHEGYGVTGKNAVEVVGPYSYYVTDQGIKAVDAQGRLDAIHTLDGLIEEWKTSLGSINLAYDPEMTALFILNPDEKKAAVMWFSSSSVSEVHDLPFSLATRGAWPSDLTDAQSELTERAFFLQNHPDLANPTPDWMPWVWVPDTKRSKVILNPASGDFNGMSRVTLLEGLGDTRFLVASHDAGVNTVTLNASTAGHGSAVPDISDNWVGAYVYIINSSDTSKIGEKAQIVKVVNSDIDELTTYDDGGDPRIHYQNESSGFAPVAGDRIGISPVFMKWTGSPLGGNDMDEPVQTSLNFHTVRLVDSVSGYFSLVSGPAITDTVDITDAVFKTLVYEGDSVSELNSGFPLDLSGSIVRSIAEGESTYWANLGSDTTFGGAHGVKGTALTPSIEVFCPDLDFRLLAVIIDGKILPSLRTERPS